MITTTAVVAGVLPARGDTGTQTPGAPSITSVTAGDRQLTVKWSASSTPADRPVIDYQVMYRPGSSGAWSMASTYSVSYDSDVQDDSDTTWAHNRNPLDLGTLSGDVAAYIERTTGGRHDLEGIYRVKTDVAAVRIRVDGNASGAATIRGNYTTAPITDLRHNGTELGRVTQTATQTGFQLAAVTPPLSSDSYIWIDGWDHTSTNTKFPEFAAVTVDDRRLRIDIATVSVATSTTISGLTNQRSHQVRVRARNSAGWSAWSSVSSGTPLGTPDAPTGLWLESGNQQFIARWTAPANDGGYTISDYDIQYRADTPGATWTDWQASTTSTATTTTINTGVNNATKYRVRVRAVNSAGAGPWTLPVIDTAGKPSPPAITLETIRRPRPAGKHDAGGLLSMTLTAADNGSAVTDYDVRYRESGTTTWYTYRDRSDGSGRLTTSEASGPADPIDFGVFGASSSGVSLTRESVGTGANAKAGLYKVSKAVDQLWIRASATITGGGTVAARWHTSKPTAANLATAGTQIFSAATESDNTVWQDGWVVDLPANAYFWLHTIDTETLTKRHLNLDFTDNTTGGAMVSRDSGTLTTDESSDADDPIDFGEFTTPSGGVTVTRESIGTGANAKAGVYKLGSAVDRLWIRVSGTVTPNARVVARWDRSKPTAANLTTAGTEIFRVVLSNLTFWLEGGAFNLPANAYLWIYTTGFETLSERRLQLDFTDDSAGTAMVLSGLRNGRTYELQARATNARGTGVWASASGTVGAPSRPEVEEPVAKHQALDVAWARLVSDNASGVTGYDVRYRAGTSGAWTSWPHGGTLRATTITGLTNNTEYEVQVRAKNLRGNGFWSASVKGTPAPQPPDAPGAPTLTSSGTTMSVSWAAPSANGADITDYDVQYCSAGCTNDSNWTSIPDTTPSTALSSTITGLTNGTTYQVQVRAQNSVGAGDWSNSATHTIGRPSAPAAPTLTTGNAQLTATWTAASGNGSTITDYDVQYCSAGCTNDANWTSIPDTTPSTALSYTITGLTNGTTYQVRVRAENSAGNGPWSPAASVEVGLPSVPSAVTVSAGNETLTVNWTASAGNGSAITDYDVRYCSVNCDSSESAWQEHSQGKNSLSTFATLRSLTNGTEYQIQVRADNRHGSSLWSPTVTATPGVPAAPSAPTLTAADHKILVDWSAPADNGTAISDYDVQYSSDGGTTWTELNANTTSTATDALITGLTPSTSYQVQVQAENTVGTGPWSASGTLTLPVSPVPGRTLGACDPAGITQLWVDYACYIKAGERGIKPFDTVTITGSSGDYVQKIEHRSAGAIDVAEVLAYNPQGGLAIVETSLDGAVQDRFLIDVIRFSIRSRSISGNLVAGDYFNVTVRLHSPDHGSPDKYATNGTDLARSWVKLDLSGANTNLAAHDHKRGLTHDMPVQVVEQHGDSVTFRVYAVSAGTYDISIHAYRPAPDADCPTQGPLRCWTPPDGSLTETYIVASTVSMSAAVGLPAPPSAPSGLTASPGAESVTLTWNDPSDPTISGYEYQMRWAGVAWGQWTAIPDSGATTTSHTITGLTNGTEYRFHLRAVNPGGTGTAAPTASPWYVSATPQVPPTTPPATPSAITVTRADGTLTATWDAIDTATSYHITYSTNNGASWHLAAINHPDNTITINNATNTATYIIGVRARNSAGDSGWRNSPPAAPYTPPPSTTPPATPSAITVTRADGTLTATWPAVDTATSYHITYSTNGGASWHLAAFNHPDNTITINNATNTATYIIAARARNAAGYSAWRNSPPAPPYEPPPPTTPPATPSAITVTRADGTLTATWPAVDTATSYHITYSTNGGASWHLAAFNHPDNTITINNATNTATYIIAARARNAAGYSAWRNSPPAPPYEPG